MLFTDRIIIYHFHFHSRCSRLGLVSLSYLWRRDQEQLLKEMIECSVNAVIIKVASLGLEPRHLGKSISEMQPHLAKMVSKRLND